MTIKITMDDRKAVLFFCGRVVSRVMYCIVLYCIVMQCFFIHPCWQKSYRTHQYSLYKCKCSHEPRMSLTYHIATIPSYNSSTAWQNRGGQQGGRYRQCDSQPSTNVSLPDPKHRMTWNLRNVQDLRFSQWK
jgi:hypothetical protein